MQFTYVHVHVLFCLSYFGGEGGRGSIFPYNFCNVLNINLFPLLFRLRDCLRSFPISFVFVSPTSQPLHRAVAIVVVVFGLYREDLLGRAEQVRSAKQQMPTPQQSEGKDLHRRFAEAAKGVTELYRNATLSYNAGYRGALC